MVQAERRGTASLPQGMETPMLVLSRRVGEEVVVPGLDIRIKVLRCYGNRVQVGVEAPDSIEIVRGERVDCWKSKPQAIDVSPHEFRNLANSLRLSWELYSRQMSRGDVDAARQTLVRLVARLRQVDQEQPAVPTAVVEQQSNPPKVLVVDDDVNERQLLAGLLQMDGCRVETARDGLDAITALRNGTSPDVVLLDMQMPRLGGKDTLQAIRDGGHQVLVFGVSGSTPAENDIAVGGSGGIDEWFEKPLNPSQLVHRLRQRLGYARTVSV
jgi:carbon storage regulator CsrA